MTWLQLQEQIRAMTAAEKLQEVSFIENRHDGTATAVSFQCAEIERTYYEHTEWVFTLSKGQPYLG